MAPHLGLEKIAWLGLAKKQKLLFIVQHIQKLRTRFSVFLRFFFSKFG
jgi:hypothetical protein